MKNIHILLSMEDIYTMWVIFHMKYLSIFYLVQPACFISFILYHVMLLDAKSDDLCVKIVSQISNSQNVHLYNH